MKNQDKKWTLWRILSVSGYVIWAIFIIVVCIVSGNPSGAKSSFESIKGASDE